MLLALLIGFLIISLLAYVGLSIAVGGANQGFIEISGSVQNVLVTPILFMYYSVCTFGGLLLAAYVGASAMAREISDGSIAMVLSRPVARWQFLLGKYFGAVAVLLCYAGAIGLVLVLLSQVHSIDPEVVPALAYAPLYIFCSCLIVCSLAMLLSTLMHPLLAGLVAYLTDVTRTVLSLLPIDEPFSYIVHIFPSYHLFNLSGRFLGSGQEFSLGESGILVLYSLNLSMIFLLLAMWRLRYKEVG